jgi:putative membrane protein (TIGR04086 family)
MNSQYTLDFLQIFKAVLIALACSVGFTLLLAFVLRVANLTDGIILPANVCIKAVSLLLGCFCALRGEKGWLRGGIAGVLFIALSGLLFAFIGGDFSFSWLIIAEVAFGVIVGALAGIFAVNIKG